MVRPVESLASIDFQAMGERGVGGEPLRSHEKSERLGTEAGGIGVHVGYGGDDNLVTITEVA